MRAMRAIIKLMRLYCFLKLLTLQIPQFRCRAKLGQQNCKQEWDAPIQGEFIADPKGLVENDL